MARCFQAAFVLSIGLAACSPAPGDGGGSGDVDSGTVLPPGTGGAGVDAMAVGGSDGGATGAVDAADPAAIDVYLIGGQSNATGQGYTRNLPAGFAPDTRVLLYHSGAPHLISGAAPDTWIPLRQASESPDRFGPELGFGNRIQELFAGRRIAIIKHAHTGTSLFADWAPGASATDTAAFGLQFQVFVATVDAALQKLRDMGLHPIVRGMLWQQGEADADRGGTIAAAYGQNLAAFIARVRAQWGGPAMLFVYGYVYPPPTTGAGRDLVRAGERDVDQDSGAALAVPRGFVIPTDDLEQRADDPGTPLPNDRIHFGSAGQLELGRRMADKVGERLGL